MFNIKLILNRDCRKEYDTLLDEVEKRGGISIYAHPFYEWFELNIDSINYKLLKACMTNIVPLGENGRRFFEIVAMKRKGFYNELLGIYNKSEKMYRENKLRIKSYVELIHLGYTGQFLGGKCPVDEVLKCRNSTTEDVKRL